MKKILFPFTIHQKNQEAFIYAVKLARRTGAQLIMLNVYQLEVDKISSRESYNKLVREHWLLAYKEIVRFNNYFIANHARIQEDLQIRFDFRFIHGELKKELHQIFDNEEIDLCVISLVDEREEDARLIRFMNKEILFRTANSVLLVPGRMNYQKICNMAFIISEAETGEAAENFIKVTKLAQLLGADLHIVFSSLFKKEEQLHENPLYMKAGSMVGKDSGWTLRICDPKEINAATNSLIKELNIDLLAFDEREPGIYDKLFHISSINEILDQSLVPVLIHPLKAR